MVDCAVDGWTVRGPGGECRRYAAAPGLMGTICSGDSAGGDGPGAGAPDGFAPPAVTVDVWADALLEALADARPSATGLIVAAPSEFGGPRRSLVAAAAATLGHRADVVPRAVALVRTHGLLFCRRALVLEATDGGGPGVDAGGGPDAIGHVLDFTADGWVPVRAGRAPDTVGLARCLLDDGVDQVLVDADQATYERVRDALAVVEHRQWRVLRIDRSALVAALAEAPEDESGRPPVEEPARLVGPGRRARRGPALWIARLASAVAVILVATGAALVGLRTAGPRDPAPPPAPRERTATQTDTVDGVEVALPVGWSITRPAGGRAVARAPDGRRVTVVHRTLPAPTSRDAVAADLASALPEQGDARIVGLEPRARYAGRDVIGYREQITPQRFVLWYVVIDGGHQVSIGCEPGIGAAPIAEYCARAVGSVRPR
ncbi:type VII secretion-associated protein [Tsukamurella soli]|uniref:Type VII secretion-associated protein, Rv3446c family, C-terminal domain-containing protein n=1 Tax=Tsukamurella soli TaxID=644556 RepID=A0ABP8K3S9_9ACTN